jgi:penicillin-binding protein
MKKLLYIFFIILFLIGGTSCDEEKHDPLVTYHSYKAAFAALDYSAMYDNLDSSSKSKMTKEAYVELYKGFYGAISVTEASVSDRMEDIDLQRKAEGEDTIRVPVDISLVTGIGAKKFSTDIKLVRESDQDENQNFMVSFSLDQVYEGFKSTDKIVEQGVGPERGRILDRNMKVLAEDREVIWIGMVPGQFGNVREKSIDSLSAAFGVTRSYITGRLGLSWVKPETFVDMIKVSMDDKAAVEALVVSNSGITYRITRDRVYPYGEAAAHLTGFVGLATREEYAILKTLGYSITAKAGRSGLELIYEEELRGRTGTQKVLVDKDGNLKEVLSNDHNNRGKDIVLTIDIDQQLKLYGAMSGDKGTASLVNYKDGEILALVSLPSYDPNRMILGHTEAYYDSLLKDAGKPLLNRFTKLYPPGATLVSLVSASAIETGSQAVSLISEVQGTSWQKEPSWGSYFIKRAADPGTPVDLEKAFLNSDNIFFAQIALKLGEKEFIEALQRFGISEDHDATFDFQKSQAANLGVMNSEILLADSGYGQGQVLFNSLTLPRALTAIADSGNLKGLKLVKDAAQAETRNVLSAETANRVQELMRKTVDDPTGTGNAAFIEGRAIAGKTGISEVGSGTARTRYGWFTAIELDEGSPYITTVIVEGLGDRGPGYAAGKVRAFLTGELPD